MADEPGPAAAFSPRALRASVIAVAVLLGGALLLFEGRVLMLLLAGVLFAVALNGTCEWLSAKLRLPYGLLLGVVAVLIVLGLGFGGYFLGAQAVREAKKFITEVPKAWHTLVQTLHDHPDVEQIVGPLEGKAPKEGPEPGTIMSNTALAFDSLLECMGAVVVVFFIGVYGAAQPDVYPRLALRLVPVEHRYRGRLMFDEMGHELKRWLLGRLVAMLFVGVFATVGLLLMRIDLAVPLGVVAALLTFVEYVGAVASALPAALVAFGRGPIYFFWTGCLFTMAHIIEGYGLTPLLSRTTVRFPPAYTLAFQVVLGSIFGVAGLTFATPIAIVGSVMIRRLYPPAASDDET